MAAPRHIDIDMQGDVAVVRFLERKIQEGPHLEDIGKRLFALVEVERVPKVVLDFINVEIVTSSALSVLVDVLRSTKKMNSELKLCAVRPEIYEVLAITKLNKVFDIKSDVDDAIQSFG